MVALKFVEKKTINLICNNLPVKQSNNKTENTCDTDCSIKFIESLQNVRRKNNFSQPIWVQHFFPVLSFELFLWLYWCSGLYCQRFVACCSTTVVGVWTIRIHQLSDMKQTNLCKRKCEQRVRVKKKSVPCPKYIIWIAWLEWPMHIAHCNANAHKTHSCGKKAASTSTMTSIVCASFFVRIIIFVREKSAHSHLHTM